MSVDPSIYTTPNFFAKLVFAEADKSSMENFDKDAIAILHVANNRIQNPKSRFGFTMNEIFTPEQFNGVGSDEWMKAETGKLDDKEKEYFKRAMQLEAGVRSGRIKDPTGGADHYYNPKISNPDWGKLYPETYKTSGHRYLKEVPLKKK